MSFVIIFLISFLQLVRNQDRANCQDQYNVVCQSRTCELTYCYFDNVPVNVIFDELTLNDVIFWEASDSCLSYSLAGGIIRMSNVVFENYKYEDETLAELLIQANIIEINDTDVFETRSLRIYALQNLTISNFQAYVHQISIIAQGNIIFDNVYLATYFGPTYCRQDCSCEKSFNCNQQSNLSQFINLLDDPEQLSIKNIMMKTNTQNLPQLSNYLHENNYSAFIICQGKLKLLNSNLESQAIGIYAINLKVSNDSLISAEGLGCRLQLGYGCGMLDRVMGFRLKCGASGGSYGGMGGFGGSQINNNFMVCANLPPRKPYGDAMLPIYSGSGGGGEYDDSEYSNDYVSGGNGGGVIFIEVANIAIIDGKVNANGVKPYTDDQCIYFYQIKEFGSGSGGSIQIHTKFLLGSGNITANGGGMIQNRDGGEFGGFGGGGRILINYTHWHEITQPANFITLSADSGLMFPFVQNQLNYNKQFFYVQEKYQGSIMISPCRPGYSHVGYSYCKPCEPGTYKSTIGVYPCLKCINDDGLQNFTTYAEKSPLCYFNTCNSNAVFSQKKCITQWQDITNKIGGEQIIFGFWVSLGLGLLSTFIVVFKKRQKKGRNKFKKGNRSLVQDFDPSTLVVKRDESSAKPEFIVEDLPYHIGRIYLHGENCPDKPWNLDEETVFVSNQGLDLFLLEQFIKKVNKKGVFHIGIRFILLLLRYTYYPWYYILLRLIKTLNYTRITRFIVKTKMSTLNTNETNIFIKFSSTPDRSLAYIDILDYSQDALEWNNQTQFPVTLVLQGVGTFLQPLMIHTRDPLVISLNRCFQSKKLFLHDSEEGSSSEEEDDKEEITSFEHFLSKFNQLGRLIDFRQTQSEYVRACMNLLAFIESNNEEVFQNNNITIDVCVHLLANEALYPHLKSSIIMLSLRDERELKKTLREIHHLRNYSDEYEIKISISFDQIDGKYKHHLYDDQVVLVTETDLNKQIKAYRMYEDDREELNHLKQKMFRRIDHMQRPLLDNLYQSIENIHPEISQMSFKVYFSKAWLHLRRFQSICLSTFIRYRKLRMSPKVLIGLILFDLIIQSALALAYPAVLYLQYKKDDKLLLQVELYFMFFVFPFSWLFAPMFMVIWLIHSVTSVGKRFLLMNYCGIISSAFICLFGVLQMIQGLTQESTAITFLNLVKIALFANLNIFSYLGGLFLNLNDDFEQSEK